MDHAQNISSQGLRLKELGLEQDDLENAIKEGEFFRRSVTQHYPTTAIGIGGWAETVRGLRDSLSVKEWYAEDIRGVAFMTRKDGKVCIAVSSGDHGTSDLATEVASKYPKGGATYKVVEKNSQLSFLQSIELPSMKTDKQTWYLLYNRVGKQIFYELSLPLSMTEDSRLTEFAERISFPPINVDEFGLENLKENAMMPNISQEIIVDVTPKSQN